MEVPQGRKGRIYIFVCATIFEILIAVRAMNRVTNIAIATPV